MFSSIRSRLWLSYAALIAVALAIATAVLVLFLARNPMLYRETSARVAAASGLLRRERSSEARTGVIAAALDVRVLELSADGLILSDTQRDGPDLTLPSSRGRLRVTGLIRDGVGGAWLYSRSQNSDGGWLVVAAPRPRLRPALELCRDELWRPLIQGGLLALALALLVAYLVAAWIASPLQHLIEAARDVGAGEPGTASVAGVAGRAGMRVPETGPKEVRELIGAFNAMVERVAASQRSQRDFVANVSHELKTPLTSIQGFAQAIRDGTARSRAEQVQAAEIIHAEAGRMHRLAVDLLDLSALDAGTAALRFAPVDLTAVLMRLEDRLRPVAAAAGVSLELAVPRGLPTYYGDGDRLLQTFTNLAENAIKFTLRGGQVRIRSDHDDNEMRVTVADTGRGLSSEEMRSAFERFYQADAARSGGEKHGAGLGLAIARELAEAHGGRISVRSTPGHGAEFVVHLPLENGSRVDRAAT